MKLLRYVLAICFLFFGPGFVNDAISQSKSKSMRAIERRAKKHNRLLLPTESKKVRKAKKNVENQKEEQEKQEEISREEGIKKHMSRQTSRTQERMKASLEKSEELRQKREPFFKRIFKRKKHYES